MKLRNVYYQNVLEIVSDGLRSGFMITPTACTTPLVAIRSPSTTGTLFTYMVELR